MSRQTLHERLARHAAMRAAEASVAETELYADLLHATEAPVVTHDWAILNTSGGHAGFVCLACGQRHSAGGGGGGHTWISACPAVQS